MRAAVKFAGVACALVFVAAALAGGAHAQRIQYLHDAAGNVVEIRRLAADDLAILGFAPDRGAAGAIVTLDGQGFAEQPAGNDVRFNGTLATVLSATSSRLVVAAPAGVTSGPITVTNPRGSAATARPFVVAAAPAIASFTPAMGVAGTAVTVAGANFEPLPINDRLSFAGTRTPVATATASTLATVVPAGAASGRLTLTTPNGTTISATDFFVVPAAIPPASVGFTGRVAVDGGTLAVSVPAGQVALLAFDAAAGDAVTFYFAGLAAGTRVAYTLHGAANAVLASDSVTTAYPFALLPAVASGGTFLLALKAGTAPFAATVRAETARRLVADGSAASATIAVPGQPARIAFAAGVGQNLGIGVTGLALSPASPASVGVDVLRPDGSVATTFGCAVTGDSCSANFSPSVPGTHGLWIRPPASATGSMQLWLSNDLVATLAPGSPYALPKTRPGQNARLAFDAAAGPGPAIQVAGIATEPTGQSLQLSLYRPDGALWDWTLVSDARTWTLASYPQSGTYRLLVEPRPSYKGAAAIVSARVTLAAGIALAVDGAATTSTFPASGDSARYVFDAVAGGRLGLGFTALALTPATASATISAYRPDGVLAASGSCSTTGTGCAVNLSPSVTGRFSIVVSPASGATGSVVAWLSADKVVDLAAGTQRTAATERPGQNLVLRFAGTAGQSLQLRVAALATDPGSQRVEFRVLKPDGSVLTSAATTTAPYAFDIPALPVTGSYSMQVEPLESGKGAATMNLQLGVFPR